MKNLSFLLLLIFVSCGPQLLESEENSDRYIDNSTGVPVKLILDREECAEDSSLYSYELNLPVPANIIPFRLRSSLIAQDFKHISKVDFAGEFIQKIKIDKIRGNKAYGSISKKTVHPSIPLKLCAKDYAYFSYQDAALKVIFAVTNSFEQISKILPQIAPVHLRIAPILTQVISRKRSGETIHESKTLVNNALYSPRDQQIIFLPPGKKKGEDIPFNGIPFWDLPLIAAHEYGHHIFAQIIPSYLDITGHQSGPCFDTRSHLKLAATREKEKRNISNLHALRAINEGVADLLAYLSTDQALHNLNLIPCLTQNREVNRSTWANGAAKEINAQSLDLFFDKRSRPISSCLTEVDYQDEHILGANLAHLFNSLFDLAALSNTQRLAMTVQWMQQLNKKLKRLQRHTPREFFLGATQLMVRMHKKQFPALAADTCQLLSLKAPALTSIYPCI